MADTAAHLVDRVVPHVPVRQWVLSLPFALRYRLAYDAKLVSGVLQIFANTVFGSLLRRAANSGLSKWMCWNAPAARAGYAFSPRFIRHMPPEKSSTGSVCPPAPHLWRPPLLQIRSPSNGPEDRCEPLKKAPRRTRAPSIRSGRTT